MLNPQFRLMGVLWDNSSNAEKERMILLYKKRFKTFLCLPRSVPNGLVELMNGNFEDIIRKLQISIDLQERRR